MGRDPPKPDDEPDDRSSHDDQPGDPALLGGAQAHEPGSPSRGDDDHAHAHQNPRHSLQQEDAPAGMAEPPRGPGAAGSPVDVLNAHRDDSGKMANMTGLPVMRACLSADCLRCPQ